MNEVRDYAILGIDPAGHVTTWNAGAERIYGYRDEEVLGQHFSIFYTGEDIAAGKLEIELATAATEGSWEDQGWRVRKDGSRFWANVHVTALHGGNGRLVGFGKITRDITDYHQQSEQLARVLAELTEANDHLRSQADELSRARDMATMAVHRQEFGRRLAKALDMAEGEPEVLDVIERSLATILPDSGAELLLADNSHAHLRRVASNSPNGTAAGCGVDSPDHCPATRRAQTQYFADSEELDACPKLRGRAEGPISALCVPVSIMSRTVGVIHATGRPGAAVADEKVHDLGTLANLAGARIGLLRVMAETQLQAATDNLTGLLNRRAFEQRVDAATATSSVFSLGMGDLDRFKNLNDTYGHETGDRALRLFAQVLTESVRSRDLVSRHGGEEFMVGLPDCTATKAREIFDGVRARLDAAVTVAGLPVFTVSFGVVEAEESEELSDVIRRADAALFEAKREGRDRIVVHDFAGTPKKAPVVEPSPLGLDDRSLRGYPAAPSGRHPET